MIYRGFAVLFIVILISGCTFPAENGYQIDFDGTVNTTNEGIRMTGEVEADSGSSSERTFTNVQLAFYNQKKEKIEQVPIGVISTDDSEHTENRTIDRTFNFTPSYILLYSPDFWRSDTSFKFLEGSDTAVIAFEKVGNGYEEYYIKYSSNKFPND